MINYTRHKLHALIIVHYYLGHYWPTVSALNNDECAEIGGMLLWGKPKYLEKTCPSAVSSTTNPTWPYLGLNLGHRVGKPVSKCLSYETAGSVAQLMLQQSYLQFIKAIRLLYKGFIT
jgi:hypothetical protein